MTKGFQIAVVAGVFGFASCIKPKQCDPTPSIQFSDFTILGDSAILEFTFEDGDGDIGLKEGDTAKPFDFNLYMSYFEKINGKFVNMDSTLAIPFRFRIPYLESENSDRCLSGNVSVAITPIYRNTASPYSDTIMYSFYIFDRELRKSNEAETPPIISP
ncbi:MAG: hypothetical protein KDD54_11750 [Flavobacteriales bacterium]|nr:hypothetical protein [Flavobacteriales bacterium]